ncbi:T9SS type A sorting domain-containing protein [Flavobacterium azooxidireducens]|uniref:T9SS type A sorting domain-containing protein n=1 Tax=Flavobacterium azooxidireducens TaxID=1871076 RepID=A0ABY4KI32_9FLAO|nr:T9SS type A sorting domain-containing protein [Flavobacterium azooxidireducens]UPQ80478.1 T9SS type A sorting domain-containing protein [Flavobacterium azooxidireducens]
MQRNAYLVQDIIKWVNSVKQGSLPNVVLGQSMGGVLARYALRDMENQLASSGDQTWNHQANLYISHDAPHQGANIPVGIQYFARHLANQFIDTPVGDYQIELDGGNNISIADIQNLLNAQGTKQLLANYINSSFALDNSAFNTFQTELRNLGYPQQTRNVALSNGNHCANPQSFNPGANLFTLNGNASTTALTTFLTALIEPITGISAPILAFEFNEPGLLLGMLPGSSSFAMNFKANALPTAGSTIQVYHGSISYTKKIFSLFGWNPKITVSLTSRSHNNPALLSYDYYPGGKYQLPFNFSTSTINNDFINLGISAYLAPSFNFIPTPSALDVGNGNIVLNNNDYFVKYNSLTPPTGSRTIPFNNFTTSHNTSGINENHISFNTRNGNWLALELDNITNNEDVFNCTYNCDGRNNVITGVNEICNNISKTFTAPSGGTFYNWQIIEGAHLVNSIGNSTQNFTLTALPNVYGYVKLSLTMGDDPQNNGGGRCGNITLTKNIWIGKPYVFGANPNPAELEYYVNEVCPIEPMTLCLGGGDIYENKKTICVAGLDANSHWEIVKLTTNFNFSRSNNEIYITPYSLGQISFKVRVSNSCDVSNWAFYTMNVINCNGNNFMMINEQSSTYKIYPNPSKDDVFIDLRDQNNKPDSNSKIYGELFDLMGLVKSKVEIFDNKATFSVRDLNKGIYILKIYIDDQIESHQIAVE